MLHPPDDPLEEFIPSALSRDPFIRYWALSCAWDVWEAFPSPKYRQALRAVCRLLLHDSDPRNREVALDYLAYVGTRSDLHALFQLQSDPEPKVRCAVIVGLGRVGGPRMAARIRAFTADPDPLVHRFAYLELNDLSGASIVPWLLEQRALETDDLALIGIEMALTDHGDHEAIARVTAYAQSEQRFLFRPARTCLAELRLPLPPNPVAEALDQEQAVFALEPYPTYFGDCIG